MTGFARQIIYILVFIFVAGTLSGHPLDISLTTIQFDNANLYGTTYIHPYELGLLAKDHHINLESMTPGQLQRILLPYFRSHFKIYTRQGLFPDFTISIQNTEIYQILSSGVYINFVVDIDRNMYPVTFHIDLFVEYFKTQTNKIIFLDKNGDLYPGSNEIFLTARIKEWSFDRENPDFSAYEDDFTDTDGDGLSDHFERLYGLNPSNPDTDKDGYTDADEFNFGWDPFNPGPSPGQSKEMLQGSLITDNSNNEPGPEDIPESVSREPYSTFVEPQLYSEKRWATNNDTVETQPEDWTGPQEYPAEPKNLINEYSVTDKNIPDSGFLEKTLLQMKSVFSENFSIGGLFLLFISVFILGFLHASMPGHGKGILIAFLTEKNKKFLHALGFIVTFTITHLIDVIILAMGFSIFLSAVNTTSVTYVLRIAGGTGLLVIAGYLIYEGIKSLKKPDTEHEVIAKVKKKGPVILGFLTGLAPCPFGWALLMMLLSIGRIEMVPIIILIFGLGIFCFLFIVSVVIFIVRYVAFDIFSVISKYSRLVSGILLLLFAILFFSPRILF
ncbi:MAG: hypothetical protein JXB88_16810 [Spirochaetales bacterium]|nr:hypothetical protein [Spirochaetales bacterium]